MTPPTQESREGNDQNNGTDQKILERQWLARLILLQPCLLPFSSLIRHRFLFYTTTRSADGKTSSVWHWMVMTSPSTMTSTGSSR